MGLLPTGTGDWLAFETRGVVRFIVLLLGVTSQCIVPGDITAVTRWIHPIPRAIIYTREHNAYYERKGVYNLNHPVLPLAQESSSPENTG